jgi:large-conductance mechanosensitive channel
MADQTDVAIMGGFISLGIGAIAFQKLTGITGWIAYPIGAIIGFLIVSIFIFFAISLLAKLMPGGNNENKDNNETENKDNEKEKGNK